MDLDKQFDYTTFHKEILQIQMSFYKNANIINNIQGKNQPLSLRSDISKGMWNVTNLRNENFWCLSYSCYIRAPLCSINRKEKLPFFGLFFILSYKYLNFEYVPVFDKMNALWINIY